MGVRPRVLVRVCSCVRACVCVCVCVGSSVGVYARACTRCRVPSFPRGANPGTADSIKKHKLRAIDAARHDDATNAHQNEVDRLERGAYVRLVCEDMHVAVRASAHQLQRELVRSERERVHGRSERLDLDFLLKVKADRYKGGVCTRDH
jgi:hypothetical protein